MQHPKICLSEYQGILEENLTHLVDDSKEDILLLTHDDTFIYGDLSKYFKLAREYVVTPTQCTYSPIDKVKRWLEEKYPQQVPLGEEYSFILQFFFISRSNLTSKDFEEWKYEDMGADLGFKLMLELLEKKVEFIPLRNNRLVNLFSKDNFKEIEQWKEDGWFHAESLTYHLDDIYNHPENLKNDRATQLRFGLLLNLDGLEERIYKIIKDNNIDMNKVLEFKRRFKWLVP